MGTACDGVESNYSLTYAQVHLPIMEIMGDWRGGGKINTLVKIRYWEQVHGGM